MSDAVRICADRSVYNRNVLFIVFFIIYFMTVKIVKKWYY